MKNRIGNSWCKDIFVGHIIFLTTLSISVAKADGAMLVSNKSSTVHTSEQPKPANRSGNATTQADSRQAIFTAEVGSIRHFSAVSPDEGTDDDGLSTERLLKYGGAVQLIFFCTERFALGPRIGGFGSFVDGQLFLDFSVGWDIETRHPKISVPVLMHGGLAFQFETEAQSQMVYYQTGLAFGAKIRFGDRVGLAVLCHLGLQTNIMLTNLFIGGNVGPIIYF